MGAHSSGSSYFVFLFSLNRSNAEKEDDSSVIYSGIKVA